MRRCATLLKSFVSLLIHSIRGLRAMWGWILRMWDNGGRNIKLDQVEFVDRGFRSLGSRPVTRILLSPLETKLRKGKFKLSHFKI